MRRSSTNEPPEPVFFTDRDLGPTVADTLRHGGLRVEPYHEHFALDDVPDQEWLRLVGERGWIALTHNKRIRWERDELDELMICGVRAFFIIGKGPHPELARAVLDGRHRIERFLRKHRGPFAARIYQQGGTVDMWVTRQQWLESRRDGVPK
jgi:PIN like domain